jgi:hypothetical protein
LVSPKGKTEKMMKNKIYNNRVYKIIAVFITFWVLLILANRPVFFMCPAHPARKEMGLRNRKNVSYIYFGKFKFIEPNNDQSSIVFMSIVLL